MDQFFFWWSRKSEISIMLKINLDCLFFCLLAFLSLLLYLIFFIPFNTFRAVISNHFILFGQLYAFLLYIEWRWWNNNKNVYWAEFLIRKRRVSKQKERRKSGQKVKIYVIKINWERLSHWKPKKRNLKCFFPRSQSLGLDKCVYL